jgi:chromosome partitioning protein
VESARKPAEIARGRIALINHKGGPGKTTLAHNLAFTLGNMGLRCLLVDADRQGSLTLCCGVDIRDEPGCGLGYVLLEAAQNRQASEELLRKNLVQTYNPNVDLLPTNEQMYEAQLRLQVLPDANFLLTRILRPLYDEYDFIFIDCPPDLGLITVGALISTEWVIMPVDYNLSVFTVEQFSQTLIAVRESFNRSLDILGIVLNKFGAHTTNGRNIEETVQAAHGDRLFRTRIARSEKVPESQWLGRAFVDVEPRHPVSLQFRQLADEVLDRIRAMGADAERQEARE